MATGRKHGSKVPLFCSVFQQQAEALGIDLERLAALCSSRMPQDLEGVEMIAARMGWEVERTAELLGMHTRE